MAFLTPLILFLIIGIAQAALWAHASAVAQAAADYGADVGSTYGAAAADGPDAARSFIAQSGGLNGATVVSTSTRVGDVDQVTIVVSGQVPSVVGALTVQATSTSTVEAVRP